MGEFKKARDEFEHEITEAVKQAETEVVTQETVIHQPAISDPSGRDPQVS